ncbi:MAG: 23S rRNA (uracil(1939)-C(5))-methyltransferase RlmD [Vicinamibacterales bacterium]
MTCAHAGTCGGCSLLHLSYDAQLSRKDAALRNLLAPHLPRRIRDRAAGIFQPVDYGAGSPAHFRQKVAFVFAPASHGRGLAMGHYQRGSQRVVPVVECPVHSERGNRIAFALRDHLGRAGVSAADPSLAGVLRHLLVRTTADDREAIAMLVVTRNDKRLRQPVRRFLDSADRPDGFFININPDPGPFMVGARTIRIDGRSQIRETVGGLHYLVSPTAFFQTNVRAAAVLQDYVWHSMEGCARVLDLYCGGGLFALRMAAAGAHVTGIEENRQATLDAIANARLNGISASSARFIAATVEEGVRRVSKDGWDGVVLDPPRQGCSDQVLEAVFQELRPARVTYVSCNPDSLSAELGGILQCGYKIEDLAAVDMFPHTDHVEAIVRLRRL